MSERKDCAKATYAGFCEAKLAWTALDAPACESFELHPDITKLHNADSAIRAKEKELAAVHGTVCDLEDMLRELFGCLEGHCIAHLPPTDYTPDVVQAKLAKHGIKVKRT